MSKPEGVRDYWLLHMKVGEHLRDMAASAWNRNEVGVWCGPFTAQELSTADATADVNELAHQAAFLQARGITAKTNKTKVAFEFANLPDGAWIVLRLDGKTFGIGQICSALESSATHPLNHLMPSDPKHEVFKYRKIVLSTKREIRLSLEERAPLMRALKSYDPLRRFSSAEEVALLNRLLDTGGR